VPNLRSSPKIQTYSSSRSCEVIDLGANQKRTCNFLLIINSNFGRISYHFRLTWIYLASTTPPLFDASVRGEPVRNSEWNLLC